MAYTVKQLKEDLEKIPEDWVLGIDAEDYLYAMSQDSSQYVDIFTD